MYVRRPRKFSLPMTKLKRAYGTTAITKKTVHKWNDEIRREKKATQAVSVNINALAATNIIHFKLKKKNK